MPILPGMKEPGPGVPKGASNSLLSFTAFDPATCVEGQMYDEIAASVREMEQNSLIDHFAPEPNIGADNNEKSAVAFVDRSLQDTYDDSSAKLAALPLNTGKRRKWTAEEDEELMNLMQQARKPSYAEAAQRIAALTKTQPWAKEQVSQRWRRVLLKKRGAWTADEDDLVMRRYTEFGNKWAAIARAMGGGYSDQQIKYRVRYLQTQTAE